MRKISPDVLFVGTPKASFLALVAGKLTRVPRRVYGLWGLRLETTAGLSRKVFAGVERAASAAATDVLAVSRSLADKYLELRLCRLTKILVIGGGSSHGVNTERFTPAIFESTLPLAKRIGLAEGIPVLGFVGRFSRDKGADSLLGTRMLLSEKNIDHELLVVGSVEGETDVLSKLNDFGRRVKHVGVVSDVELYYKLMDILLLPTLREGFPNVVLEAAASGVPAVTTDATGAVDSVVNGVTGITVPFESSKDFSEAVLGLLCNPDSITRLGRSARARAVADFSEAAVLASIMEFLEKLPKRK
jgi:glycosyltransferase involved in cell wall biosynthesis